MSAKARVVVVGGGFAGLETAFTLRQRLGEKAKLALVADRADFLFTPNTVYLPFGGREDRLHIPLNRPLARRDIAFYPGAPRDLDADGRTLTLTDGTRLPYDHLVLATGAAMRPQEVPGLAEHAHAVWTPGQLHALGTRFQQLRSDALSGYRRRVLFLVPPNNKCSGPLYEIAFMLDTWLRKAGCRDTVRISWATCEDGYLQAFGPRLHQVVAAEFADRRIDGHTGLAVDKISAGEAAFTNGELHGFDLLVAFPPYAASVCYPGLPADDRGFLTLEPATRRVVGHPEIHAPGDAGDFPVKQAFLAFLQADAAADDIAAALAPKAVPRPRRFTPTSMCVMEMYDKATFAQVPLRQTGDAAHPVSIDESAPGDYRVGVSPLWRLGKAALGIYLPLQFRAGRPFHGGRAWTGMQVALDGMSRALASGATVPAPAPDDAGRRVDL